MKRKANIKFQNIDNNNGIVEVALINNIVLDRVISRDIWRRNLITQVSNGVDNVAVSVYLYDYDELNRATSRNTDTFGYNPRSEVTSASISNNVASYAYDNIGNNQWTAVNGTTNIYTANALNQYSQIFVPSVPSVENLSYALDGNMISNGNWSYTWDAENRLKAAYSNSVSVVSNAYDYMNRRVQKTTSSGTTTFVYDGWNLIQETIATASGVTTNSYVWGKDLSGTLQGAGGVGGLLATCLDGDWCFPFADANGNITAYIDALGSVVAEYTYNAFGETIAQSGSLADIFRFRFSTKYYDTESNLYSYGMRYYSPNLHRWINRDPIEEKGGVGIYEFCGNDGVNQVDVFGLKVWIVTGDMLGYNEKVSKINRDVDIARKKVIQKINKLFESGSIGKYKFYIRTQKHGESTYTDINDRGVDLQTFFNTVVDDKAVYVSTGGKDILQDMEILKETVSKHKNSWDGTAYVHHTTPDDEVIYNGDVRMPRSEVDHAYNQIVPSIGYLIHASCKPSKSESRKRWEHFEQADIVFTTPTMPANKCYLIWYPLHLKKTITQGL